MTGVHPRIDIKSLLQPPRKQCITMAHKNHFKLQLNLKHDT